MAEEKLSKKELKELKAAEKQARKDEIERQMDEKRLKKAQKLLAKYGLENLTDPADIISISYILGGLSSLGRGALEWGLTLGGGKWDEAQYYMEKGIFEQNLIIIRQLDRITQLLKKIADEQ